MKLSWLMPAALGVGSLLAVSLLLMLAFWTLSGSSNVVEMTYLPKDTELLIHVNLRSVVSSSMFRDQLAKRPMYAESMSRIEKQTGLSVDDLDRLTIGFTKFSGKKFKPQGFVAVLRLNKDLDEAKFATAGFKLEIENDRSGKLYVSAGDMALHMPNRRILVFGTTEQVKKAMSAGPEHRFEQFDFVNGSQQAFLAWVPRDQSALRNYSKELPANNRMLENVEQDLKKIAEVIGTNLHGVAVGGNLRGASIDATFQVKCDSATAGSQLQSALSNLISEGKRLYREQRSKVPEDAKELVDVADHLMSSLSVYSSGNSVSLYLSVPQNDSVRRTMESGFESRLNPLGQMGNVGRGPGHPGRNGNPNANRNGGFLQGALPSSSATRSRMIQLGVSLHRYHDTFKRFPPRDRGRERPKLSWRVHLLPYIQEKRIYDQFKLDESWDSPHNQRLLAKMPKIFKRAGSLAAPGMATILGVDALGSAFAGGRGVRLRDMLDGMTTTTLLVAVDDAHGVPWTKPVDYQPPASDLGGGLYSPPGSMRTMMVFADGSVRSVNKRDASLLSRLFNVSDGKPVDFR